MEIIVEYDDFVPTVEYPTGEVGFWVAVNGSMCMLSPVKPTKRQLRRIVKEHKLYQIFLQYQYVYEGNKIVGRVMDINGVNVDESDIDILIDRKPLGRFLSVYHKYLKLSKKLENSHD